MGIIQLLSKKMFKQGQAKLEIMVLIKPSTHQKAYFCEVALYFSQNKRQLLYRTIHNI